MVIMRKLEGTLQTFEKVAHLLSKRVAYSIGHQVHPTSSESLLL